MQLGSLPRQAPGSRCPPPSRHPAPALRAAALTWRCGEDEGQEAATAAAAEEPGGAQPHGRGRSAELDSKRRGSTAHPPAAGGRRDSGEGKAARSSRPPCPAPAGAGPAHGASQPLPSLAAAQPGRCRPALCRGGGEGSGHLVRSASRGRGQCEEVCKGAGEGKSCGGVKHAPNCVKTYSGCPQRANLEVVFRNLKTSFRSYSHQSFSFFRKDTSKGKEG